MTLKKIILNELLSKCNKNKFYGPFPPALFFSGPRFLDGAGSRERCSTLTSVVVSPRLSAVLMLPSRKKGFPLHVQSLYQKLTGNLAERMRFDVFTEQALQQSNPLIPQAHIQHVLSHQVPSHDAVYYRVLALTGSHHSHTFHWHSY